MEFFHAICICYIVTSFGSLGQRKKDHHGRGAVKERKSGIALRDRLRMLLKPVDSSGADRHDDGWANASSYRNPRLSSIGPGLFWWLMSVLLGLLVSRLH